MQGSPQIHAAVGLPHFAKPLSTRDATVCACHTQCLHLITQLGHPLFRI